MKEFFKCLGIIILLIAGGSMNIFTAVVLIAIASPCLIFGGIFEQEEVVIIEEIEEK